MDDHCMIYDTLMWNITLHFLEFYWSKKLPLPPNLTRLSLGEVEVERRAKYIYNPIHRTTIYNKMLHRVEFSPRDEKYLKEQDRDGKWWTFANTIHQCFTNSSSFSLFFVSSIFLIILYSFRYSGGSYLSWNIVIRLVTMLPCV